MMSSALNQTLICHHFKEANSIAKGFFTFSGFIQTNWQNHCRLKAPVKSIFPSTASPRYIYIYFLWLSILYRLTPPNIIPLILHYSPVGLRSNSSQGFVSLSPNFHNYYPSIHAFQTLSHIYIFIMSASLISCLLKYSFFIIILLYKLI